MKPNPTPGPGGSAPVPSISDAEWVVMKVLWRQHLATANQIVELLSRQTAWKPKTIHTLLRRLVQKGAVGYEKQGREFVYQPLIEADRCVHVATRSFLDRFFEGRVAPFLACFLEKEKLSKRELAELRRILDQMGS